MSSSIKALTPDVVEALETGKTSSAFEHYVRAGAFEGRHANALNQESAKQWAKLFQPGDAPQKWEWISAVSSTWGD